MSPVHCLHTRSGHPSWGRASLPAVAGSLIAVVFPAVAPIVPGDEVRSAIANAWLVTPSVAVEWKGSIADGEAMVRGHVARSWTGSFDETDSVQHFNEAAYTYSIRGEYVPPTGWKVLDRVVNAAGHIGHSGFFGANRDALGFDAVAQAGPAEDGGMATILDLAGAVVHFAAVFNVDQRAVAVGPALGRVGGGGTATLAHACVSMIRWTLA